MDSREQKIRALLAEVYTAEGVEIYMSSRNRNLHGRRPNELIQSGYPDLVLAEVERLAL